MENKDEVIVRELPLFQWIFYSISAIVAALTIYFANSGEMESPNVLLMLGMTLTGGLFLLLMMTSPATNIKINRSGKTISVRKRSLVKYSFKVYSFKEAEDLIYLKKVKEKGGVIEYQLILPLKNMERIELSIGGGSTEEQYRQAADLMNSYIFGASKPIPS